MAMELSPEEKDLLADLLEHELEEIHGEIRRTQNHEYKENLKARERLVRDLLSRLRA